MTLPRIVGLLSWLGTHVNGVRAYTAVWSLMIAVATSGAVNGQDLQYKLQFPNAAQHFVDVRLEFPADRDRVELMMPVWTPGSYLIREYPRFVQDIQAFGDDDQPLTLTKTRKNRWTIETAGIQRVAVQYRVYGHELSVRTNWVDGELAVLNGAATFVVPVDRLDQAISVEVQLPPTWQRSVCALPVSTEQSNRYLARDFDQLVDSPILCGDCQLFPFQVDGVNHYLVNIGDTELWDGQRAANDLKKVVSAQQKFWGELPYPEYYFLNVVLGVSSSQTD